MRSESLFYFQINPLSTNTPPFVKIRKKECIYVDSTFFVEAGLFLKENKDSLRMRLPRGRFTKEIS